MLLLHVVPSEVLDCHECGNGVNFCRIMFRRPIGMALEGTFGTGGWVEDAGCYTGGVARSVALGGVICEGTLSGSLS